MDDSRTQWVSVPKKEEVDDQVDDEWDDDFPPIYYEDTAPVSPVTRRWPGLNPWKYYMDVSGRARPYPGSLETPVAALEAIVRKPPVLPREHLTVVIPDFDFWRGLLSLPSSPRDTSTNRTQPTILQRRKIRARTANIKQPLVIVVAGNDNDGHPHLITNIDREQDVLVAKRDQYPHRFDRDDPFWAANPDKEYLNSIGDYDQMLRTWHAGVNATYLVEEDGDWVWVDPYQPGHDFEPYIRSFERMLEKGRKPRYWYEPQIGDIGVPDQYALEYVLGVRDKTEKLRAAIKRREVDPVPEGLEAIMCVPLPPRLPRPTSTSSERTGSQGATHVAGNDKAALEPPPRRPRIRVLHKDWYIRGCPSAAGSPAAAGYTAHPPPSAQARRTRAPAAPARPTRKRAVKSKDGPGDEEHLADLMPAPKRPRIRVVGTMAQYAKSSRR